MWDETVVLPPSTIGELAAFARRSGDRWFVGALNGPQARTLRLNLAFLGQGPHRALLVRDKAGEASGVEVEPRDVTPRDSLEIPLQAGGGFVARFYRRE